MKTGSVLSMRFPGESSILVCMINVRLLTEICSMASHPESFPVNTLVPIEGTPLEKNDVSIPYSAPVVLHMPPS